MSVQSATEEKLFPFVSQLKLTMEWPHNHAQIAELLRQYFPSVEMSAYWFQHGEAAHITPRAEQLFGDYVASLKRTDLLSNSGLQPIAAVDGGWGINIALGESPLGILMLWAPTPGDRPTLEHLAHLLLPQLALARYATSMAEEVDKRTSTDKVTGLWNRTYFNERFREECERLARSKEIGTVAVLALDDLGAMSRVLGADEYQKLLASSGQTVRRIVRQTDWVVHWDNNEFLFYFPNTQPEQSLEVLNRCMTQLIANNAILHSVIGLCSTNETTSARALIQLAARRLDLARKDGRKKVICFASKTSGLQFWMADA